MDPQQLKYLETENLILVDSLDIQIGSASKKECHQNPLLLHRAFSVFIFRDGKLLLQKRSKYKPTFPLIWTNSCCSHPLDGEEVLDAAVRKVKHELGMDIHRDELKFVTRIIYRASSSGIWGEYELDHVFICNLSCEREMDINPNEVADTIEVSREELSGLILEFSPWFKLIHKHFLMDWWNNLDSLSSDQEIHAFIDQGIQL